MDSQHSNSTRSFEQLPRQFQDTQWSQLLDTRQRYINRSGQFPSTNWEIVADASQPQNLSAATEALDVLVRAYWYPLYWFARRWVRNDQDAEDAVQIFMSRFAKSDWLRRADRSKGKFRTFLLHSFKNRLIDLRRKERPEIFVEISDETLRDATATDTEPWGESDTQYYHNWAHTLLDLAAQRLEEEQIARGRGALFETLKPHMGSPHKLAELAARLGIPVNTVKGDLHRLKKHLKELVREEVRRTLENESEVEQELRFIREICMQ